MTAPNLQAQGTIAAVTSGNLAITLPTYAANDIVVITTVGWVPNTTTGTNTQSLASPWNKYSPDVTTITSSIIDAEYAFWWARATSSSSLGTSVTITRPTSWDTGTDTCWAGRAYVVSGCVTTGNPYDAITATAISTAANPQLPAATVSGNERNVIAFAVMADNVSLPTAATGYTVGTAATTTTGTDAGFQSYSDITNANVSAVTPTGGTAPGQGGTVYFSVVFTPAVTFTTVTRSASGSGTGTESADGVKVKTRDASGSGTGTESATSSLTRARIANGDGIGFSENTWVLTKLRTADGSGTGAQTASGYTTRFRSGSGSGFGTSSSVGIIVEQRDASGSGNGTSNTTGLISRYRTASGLGTGTQSGSGIIARYWNDPNTPYDTAYRNYDGTWILPASGSGLGGQTAVAIRIVSRTADGSGSGTSSALFFISLYRVANGTGGATTGDSATGLHIAPRVATGSGLGTSAADGAKSSLRTATGSGLGSSIVVQQTTFFRVATSSAVGATDVALWNNPGLPLDNVIKMRLYKMSGGRPVSGMPFKRNVNYSVKR